MTVPSGVWEAIQKLLDFIVKALPIVAIIAVIGILVCIIIFVIIGRVFFNIRSNFIDIQRMKRQYKKMQEDFAKRSEEQLEYIRQKKDNFK